MQRALAQLESNLEQRLQNLEAPTTTPRQYTASPNYLVNSHPEWSTLAFTTAGTSPSTVSDANRNAYNWYQATAATTNLAGTTGLLASGHSGFAGLNADAPVWDAVNGTILIGGSTTLYDTFCPLLSGFIAPAHRYYVYFEAQLASADIAVPDNQQFYCGFWDNTAGQRKWIEGGTFTPTASVYGETGSRTLEYKILAETDSGEQVLSATVTVANAPATLTEANHVRLNFVGAAGFIYYGIYRKDGTNYRLVQEIRNSIDLQFYDMQESAGATVAGFPSVTTTNPRAYAKTIDFSASYGSWTPHTLTIQVPLTYDRSVTANGSQYFRMGLTELMASGDERGIQIRRVCVSEGYGGWTRSPQDLSAKSDPTVSAASGAVGGNPIVTPPFSGGGGVSCVVPETLVEVVKTDIDNAGNRIERVFRKPIRDIEIGDMVSVGAISLPVQKKKVGVVQFVYEIETENGHIIRCSDSHKFITSRFDKQGKASRHLHVGDYVLTAFTQSRIVRKDEILGEQEVISLTLPKPNLFITNGFVSHNLKLPDDPMV